MIHKSLTFIYIQVDSFIRPFRVTLEENVCCQINTNVIVYRVSPKNGEGDEKLDTRMEIEYARFRSICYYN